MDIFPGFPGKKGKSWESASCRQYMGLEFFGGLVNSKGADQPAHPRSLISAFVISFFESIISRLAMSKISIF